MTAVTIVACLLCPVTAVPVTVTVALAVCGCAGLLVANVHLYRVCACARVHACTCCLLLQVHTPAPACERTELPAYQRAVLPESKHQMSRSLTDSYVGVGPGTMAGGSTFTPEGYITAGDGGSGSMAAGGGGMDTAAALDAVTGGSSSAKANFYDHKYLQDDAMVAAIMQSEREEVAKERRRRAAAARRKQRVGRPRPAGPPSDEAGANGSLFVGKGLGLRKGVAKHDNGGSVRQVLARILDDNPEVARLRKLEQSKLPF